MYVQFVLLLLAPVVCSVPLETLTIGAFNIRIFGKTKASKVDVMENIRKIIMEYDVILIQEIRDKSQMAMEELNALINCDPGMKFSYMQSHRLGRSSSKEQYAYVYRSDKLDITSAYVFNDTASGDNFEREPYIVLLKIPLENGDRLPVALVGLHSKPTDAVAEIQKLNDVVKDVKEKFQIDNIMVMGDLNADCRYAKDDDLDNMDLFKTTGEYKSLLDRKMDTTTSTTDCAYDRIIVTGDELMSAALTPEVDRFDLKLNLTPDQTKAVSDHYPVKVKVTF